MNDKEILQSRLKTERPAVPEGFAQAGCAAWQPAA